MDKLKKYIKKLVQEQAYGHATLTTQGQGISRAPGIMENRAQELADSHSVEELNDQLKQLYRDMEQEAEPEGGPISDQYADEIYQYEEAIRIAKGIGPRDKDAGKSYTEVVLSKLAGPNDAKEYDNEKHQLIIYPGLGSLQYKSRSTQEIVFTHIEGKPAFVRAFGMTRSYDELKKVLPELGQMGDSSYSGFMNVGVDDEPIPMDNETAIEMIKAMVRGKEAEAGAQSAFYTRQPGTGGTGIDERINEISPEEATKKKNANLKQNIDIDIRLAKASDAQADKGINTQRVQLGQQLNQAEMGETKAYEARKIAKDKYLATKKELQSLKNDQDMDPAEKAQIIQDTRDLLNTSKAAYDSASETFIKAKDGTSAALKGLSGVSAAASQANKAFQKSLQQLRKSKAQIGKAVKGGGAAPIAELLLQQYINERRDNSLMEQMDIYKREILMENTMQRFFKLFDQEKTDEEVLRHYASLGVVVPEPFIKKARDQYKNLKKAKLDIEFAEQEAKDFKTVTKEEPEESKKMASRLFKEDLKYSSERKFKAPPEIIDALQNKLKINPINRFIEKFKAINSIPPSYRVFLHNGQTFDIVYEKFSLLIKIGPKSYYIADLDERNLAIKHINKLLIGDIIKPEEDEEIETPKSTPSPSSSPSPPPPPPAGDDDLDDV